MVTIVAAAAIDSSVAYDANHYPGIAIGFA
jgi:hypothetical protein